MFSFYACVVARCVMEKFPATDTIASLQSIHLVNTAFEAYPTKSCARSQAVLEGRNTLYQKDDTPTKRSREGTPRYVALILRRQLVLTPRYRETCLHQAKSRHPKTGSIPSNVLRQV